MTLADFGGRQSGATASIIVPRPRCDWMESWPPMTFNRSVMMRPNSASAQQVANASHPASARVLDRLRTRFTFQISVDVATLEQGRAVAAAALAGGVSIVEMGTPLLKNQGVANVVPAFRREFPEALLLADMTLGDGPNSLFHAGGTALVIHAAADDNKTDPSGNAGARIACGVIEKAK